MIERIRIQNFKSIKDVSIDLTPLTVFVGKSGTGKSNILAAIRLVRDYLLANDQAAEATGGWNAIMPAGRATEGFSATVTLRISGFDKSFEYAFSMANVGSKEQQVTIGESLKLGTHELFAWNSSQRAPHQREIGWVTKPSVATLPNLNWSPILGRLPTVTEAVLVFTAISSGIGFHDFPSTVLCTHDEQNKRSVFNNREIAKKFDGLQDSGANFLRIFQRITQDLRTQRSRRNIVSRLQQMNSSVNSVELDSIQNPQKLIVGHRVGELVVELQLSQESDGFRRFLAHLLALYQSPPLQTLMFEEPENGIYPGALSILAEEFGAAPLEERGQVLLSTHSPGLLDHFDPDCIRVVEMDKTTQETRVGRLDRDQLSAIRDHLLLPGELLTVDRPRIDSPKETTGA